jgi:hypothetical protein
MANWCFVTIELTFSSPGEAAERAEQYGQAADIDSRGLFLGADDRWVSDAEVDLREDTVTVIGVVRWDLNAYSFLQMIKHTGCKAARAWYDECGELLHGRYEWDGAALKCWQVPEDDYPDFTEADEEDGGVAHCAKLDDLLASQPLTWSATPEQIEEDERKYQEALARRWGKSDSATNP